MTSGADTKLHGERKYLYCLIRDGSGRPFGPSGLSAKGIGDDGARVYTVPFLDLSFVVSNCADLHYDPDRANLMVHQKVVEEVMERGQNPIPVRFSTVASAPGRRPAQERIQRVLRRRYGEFEGLLQDMEDKVELGLKVFSHRERLFEEIVAEFPQVRALRNRINSRPSSGLAWRDERIELGTLVSNAIEIKRERDSKRIVEALRPLTYDYKTNKVSTDTMVLNGAFLVYKDRVAEFDAAVQRLDEQYGERMKFKYVGCLPPFNFVEIVIQWEEEESRR